MTKIAFDIGGTSTRVAVVTAEGLGEVRKIPTPKNPQEGVVKIAELAKELAGGAIEAAAGGFPSSAPQEVIVAPPNLPAWNGFRLRDELKKALGAESVYVENDADMAALGEAVYGAGKGKRVVAYVGVGTGVGGGRVVEGVIDRGSAGLEPGHQIMYPEGLRDLESVVSGRAFETRFGVHPKDAPRSAYEEMTPILAIGLYNTIQHWSPDVLVLGGSMVFGINSYDVKEIAEAVRKISRPLALMPEIKMAELKDTAGLHGARAILMR